MADVKKAVIPVAGLGTRMLPATKAVPKELVPIVDVPSIQLVVEECVGAGIQQIIFVSAHGKHAIEDHFDRLPELEAALERKGKQADLEMVRRLAAMADFVTVRQPEPLGLGHAVLCARAVVGDEAFAVVLPDDLVDATPPGIGQLLPAHAEHGLGVVGLQEVPEGQQHLYGIVGGVRIAPRTLRLDRLVEKPAAGSAPSRLAIIGRYVLPPQIFEVLASTPRGRGDEIQLTDALATLCAGAGLMGVEIDGQRFDAGDRAGFVIANLHWALKRKDIGDQVRAEAARLLSGPRGR